MGTHGQEGNWNDRHKSQGHVGMPLISSAFVGAIPMISRLLKEPGVPLDWIDSHDSQIIKKAVGKSAGLSLVDNAAQATDNEGRKIIAVQDFASKYDVKSVLEPQRHWPAARSWLWPRFAVMPFHDPLQSIFRHSQIHSKAKRLPSSTGKKSSPNSSGLH